MLCSKLQILSSLILYSGLQKEEAAGKSYILATKNKKEVEELRKESEKWIGLDEIDFATIPSVTSTEVANTGSQPESKTDCNCGKQLINVKRESLDKEKERLASEISGGEEAKPNEFPWAVRILGGCSKGLCGGALVSPRIILSAHHCGEELGSRNKLLCDHSDGKRKAILGSHKFNEMDWYLRPHWFTTIPIINVTSPPNGGLTWEHNSHDFALFILETPATFNHKISPICLPPPNTEFSHKRAIAAGWGRIGNPKISEKQSPHLKKVWLTVSDKKYKHEKMFGTIVSKNDDQYQDPCSGDSGGPLMYFNNASDAFTIIGTVNGNGYDCRTDEVYTFEGSENGLWNKVSAHMVWIQNTMEDLEEKVCYDDKLSNKSLI